MPDPIVTVYREQEHAWRHAPWTVIVRSTGRAEYHRFLSEHDANEYAQEVRAGTLAV